MKNSIDTNGNRTHDLVACSAVPQPTAPLCAPVMRTQALVNQQTLSMNITEHKAATQYITIKKNLAVIQLGNKSHALYARMTIL